ncbi:MAG: type IV pilus twitching motility protein PilT [Acidobacteria bacterium]|nr:type IV pilus twitching motility protein PilT [Acidobacteriota bacterium]
MSFLFHAMHDLGASDLHLASDSRPMLRKDGEMVALGKLPLLHEAMIMELLKEIVPARNAKEFQECGDTDFAYELKGVGRFRSNLYRDRKGTGAAFRIIPEKIVTVEDLNLSPKVQNLCFLPKGLVLVTGPTGSGKSTTLSAMIDLVNRKREDHIITIEDPIEFVHENKGCLVNQREVGVHTESFKRALRAALREDPDIVLVGELRDLETIAIAIETAVTGHLVFGTLHTSGAAQTIDRIIDQFPPNQQSQIRVMLSDSLKGVISQVLLKKKGGGRVAAMEVMIGIPSISNLVREGKTFQIPSVMQTSKGVGMVTLNDALFELVKGGTVEAADAFKSAVDKDGFLALLRRNNIEFEPGERGA